MYLWKCWRDTRIVLVASLVCIGVLFVSIVSKDIAIDQHAPFERFSTVLPFALTVQAFPISFVAWLLGSFGVGRDLGERSGSYVFTRPRSPSHFVWCDWGVGMGQLLPIVALLNLVLGVLLHRMIVAAGDPLNGS